MIISTIIWVINIVSDWDGRITPIDFVWIGDTLKIENFEYSYSWNIVWDLYWVRVPGW